MRQRCIQSRKNICGQARRKEPSTLPVNSLSTSPFFLLTKTNFYWKFLLNNLGSSVLVQELEFAINLVLYGLL